MSFLIQFFQYIYDNQGPILQRLLEHIQLTAIAVGAALLLGIPLGVLISYFKKANKPVLGIANLVQAIPSMALLGFAIPFLGIGYKPAIVVVVLYSLLPIIKNTYIGLESIHPDMLEAARGIGLTKLQILFKVKLPLAMPVIMAGVRISAVTAVGLMTMAAFIGGGGLGYLVFAGIRTLNNYQILAGAIPACLLALCVDGIGAMVESLFAQKTALQKHKKKPWVRNCKRAVLAGAAILLAAIFILNGIAGRQKAKENVLVIGSKDYTEQVILSYLLSEAIEASTDITVVRKEALGGTRVCFGAIQSGDIDMYVEYTGTIYCDILNKAPVSDVEAVYRTVQEELLSEYDVQTLAQMHFNNTWTLSVRKDTAVQYGIKTISDLARISNGLTLAAGEEFLERADGLSGLKTKYGLHFGNEIAVNGSLRYVALDKQECEVIDAYSTEGLLKKYDLLVLEDDQNFFVPYYAVPIIKSSTFAQYPQIQPVLQKLGQHLTDEVMIDLNYQVDELRLEPEQVAHDFLVSCGLSE